MLRNRNVASSAHVHANSMFSIPQIVGALIGSTSTSLIHQIVNYIHVAVSCTQGSWFWFTCRAFRVIRDRIPNKPRVWALIILFNRLPSAFIVLSPQYMRREKYYKLLSLFWITFESYFYFFFHNRAFHPAASLCFPFHRTLVHFLVGWCI